jgi:peptidoglycan/xylan/chitin deacetylase (PgdA/CDA1 family)
VAVSLFAKTIQIYVTGACEMGCLHCASRLQTMPNMTLATLRNIIGTLECNGVERLELFANDPILHPEIKEIIGMLNASSLSYAVLTVGASPKSPNVKKRFLEVMELVDSRKGAFVFSVDYLQETADYILAKNNGDTSYAFKAQTFWEIIPLLQKKQIPVRTNTVISRYNIGEVPEIVRRVVETGFAASFCFAQHRLPEFDELTVKGGKGLTPELEPGFKDFLCATSLETSQMKTVIQQARQIVKAGQFEPFNRFRGDRRDEVDIESQKLKNLRQSLLILKKGFGDGKVLPSEEFIGQLGNRGFGCIDLLRRGPLPQLKVGSMGQMLFCCDLHDLSTQQYSITDLSSPNKRRSFLEMLRSNPYILLCAHFNPCDFSVNHVVYGARR